MESKVYSVALILCLFYFSGTGFINNSGDNNDLFRKLTVTIIRFYDTSRLREIPVALYQPTNQNKHAPKQLIIFSHGYGQNKGGDNLAYSYLTENLAANGYWVASIQHELPTDSLMPATGIPQVVRRPFWERGVENIRYVITELKKKYPLLKEVEITLIGHSNGGDMTALFPQKYPGIAKTIITLDNRRMALPVNSGSVVFSLRSNDQPADEGVIPGEGELKQSGITIIYLPHTKHNDMDDHANKKQRKEINRYIGQFLAITKN